MRRVDPPLTAAACWAVVGAWAVLAEWPVAARTALGLPLVALLPGYALSRIVFGLRLKADQRLVVSLASQPRSGCTGRHRLECQSVGDDSRSWAIGLSATTVLLAVVAAPPVRWFAAGRCVGTPRGRRHSPRWPLCCAHAS